MVETTQDNGEMDKNFITRGDAIRKRFAVYTCATTPRRLNANVRLIKLHFAAGGFRVGGA